MLRFLRFLLICSQTNTMKYAFIFLLLIITRLAGYSQEFKKGDVVEVDVLQSSYGKGNWLAATITEVNTEGMMYTVKLPDGRLMGIPMRNPEKWIKKSAANSNPKTTPAGQTYKPDPVKPGNIKINNDCSPTETNVKNRIINNIAFTFSDYEHRDIKFSYVRKLSPFKNTDPYFGRVNTTVYPFEVEYTVDLKHKAFDNSIMHRVWHFRSSVVLYKNTKGFCEFGTTKGTGGKLLLSETL